MDLVAPDPAKVEVSLTGRQRNRAGRRHERILLDNDGDLFSTGLKWEAAEAVGNALST